MENIEENNIAFIDGQNLNLGVNSENWKIDFKKFKIYLERKYKAKNIYYFLGFSKINQEGLYEKIKESGLILIFREHNEKMEGKKKGNVDVDICYEMMKNSCDNQKIDKIILISGDGDYIKPVKHLIEKGKFKKILFPNKKFSSLYKQIDTKYKSNLSLPEIKKKIEYKKMR